MQITLVSFSSATSQLTPTCASYWNIADAPAVGGGGSSSLSPILLGLSFACTRTCRFISSLRGNRRPHTVHTNGFSPIRKHPHIGECHCRVSVQCVCTDCAVTDSSYAPLSLVRIKRSHVKGGKPWVSDMSNNSTSVNQPLKLSVLLVDPQWRKQTWNYTTGWPFSLPKDRERLAGQSKTARSKV